MIVIGLLFTIVVLLEIHRGNISSARYHYVISVTQNPVAFYITVGFQSIVAVILFYNGFKKGSK
jgi:hypothetical protein